MPRVKHVCAACGKEFKKAHGLGVHLARMPKCRAALAAETSAPASQVRVVSRRLHGGARAVETQPRAVARTLAPDSRDYLLDAFSYATAQVRDIEARQESLMGGLAGFFDAVHQLRLAYIRNTDKLRQLTAELGEPRSAIARGRKGAGRKAPAAPSTPPDLSDPSDPPDPSESSHVIPPAAAAYGAPPQALDTVRS